MAKFTATFIASRPSRLRTELRKAVPLASHQLLGVLPRSQIGSSKQEISVHHGAGQLLTKQACSTVINFVLRTSLTRNVLSKTLRERAFRCDLARAAAQVAWREGWGGRSLQSLLYPPPYPSPSRGEGRASGSRASQSRSTRPLTPSCLAQWTQQ